MNKQELIDDLDMEMDVEELDMSPEYVDMSPGAYYLRVAGFTKKDIELEDEDSGDTIDGTRRAIIFQIMGIKAAEAPQPEVGGIFSQGGIMNYQIARDQFIRLVKKIVTLGDSNFKEEKHGMSEYCEKAIELFDRDQFLLCTITLRNKQYPQIRTMKAVDAVEVEDLDMDTFSFAEFEFII